MQRTGFRAMMASSPASSEGTHLSQCAMQPRCHACHPSSWQARSAASAPLLCQRRLPSQRSSRASQQVMLLTLRREGQQLQRSLMRLQRRAEGPYSPAPLPQQTYQSRGLRPALSREREGAVAPQPHPGAATGAQMHPRHTMVPRRRNMARQPQTRKGKVSCPPFASMSEGEQALSPCRHTWLQSGLCSVPAVAWRTSAALHGCPGAHRCAAGLCSRSRCGSGCLGQHQHHDHLHHAPPGP